MFTGIVECEGKIVSLSNNNGILTLEVESSLAGELRIDQSLAHNGICLTVTAVHGAVHCVSAVEETICKTTIAEWAVGDVINLERCIKLSDRLDGHIVQGHVDTCAECISIGGLPDHPVYRFAFPEIYGHLVIEKGSVCINGTSLTCFHVTKNEFEVAIIPYTYAHTSIRFVQPGTKVNIEFDVIGKYIARLQNK